MIKYYNRKTKQYEIEKVAGDKYLNWTYSSTIGMNLLELFLKKKFFSKIYGSYCDSKRSLSKVHAFVKDFDIDMSLCEKDINKFENFNDFFTRKLKSHARPIDEAKESFVSPGDGRLLVFDNIDLNKIIQVKGFTYSLYELIGDKKIADKFDGGICLVLRLCPTDYHRFHFVDSGICDETIKIEGDYYSVNPIALNKVNNLFCRNKREWSLFHSDNFGEVLHIEVGATCVGSIIQTYETGRKITKGDEKGYFKFGGSTTILFLEKNKVAIDQDILEQSKNGLETKVLMGEKIGNKII